MEQADIIANVLRQSVVGDADDHQEEYEQHYENIVDPEQITWDYAWNNYPCLRSKMEDIKNELIEAGFNEDEAKYLTMYNEF